MAQGVVVCVFYCQRLLEEEHRKVFEARFGEKLFLFPMPCSGRIEVNHMLLALERHSDVVYIITCPQGKCRYREGNVRVSNRVERAKELISSIGLEPERISLLRAEGFNLEEMIARIVEESQELGRSPVHLRGER